MANLIKKKVEKSMYELELEFLLKTMGRTRQDSKEYLQYAEAYERMVKARPPETKWTSKIDPNVVISTAGSLTAILLILNYEKFDIITSRATNFIKKF